MPPAKNINKRILPRRATIIIKYEQVNASQSIRQGYKFAGFTKRIENIHVLTKLRKKK